MINPRRASARTPKAARTGAIALTAVFLLLILTMRARHVAQYTPLAGAAHLLDAAPAPSSSSLQQEDRQQQQQREQHPPPAAAESISDAAAQQPPPVAAAAADTATAPAAASSVAKSLDCANPIRLGDDYGGWQLCRPQSGSLAGQLVYTVGIGRNIKWDVEMISKYRTVHHGWDPTPTAIDHFSKTAIPDGFTFHKYGLGAQDGNLTLKLPHGNFDSYTIMSYWQKAKAGTVVTVPILTVRSMLAQQGHSHLAILKIDIEGAEFDVIDAWHAEKYVIPADQVLMEFHERYFSHESGYRNKVKKAVQAMADLGFDLIVRTNLECTFARRDAIAQRQAGVIKGK